jgi:hypothetical protein
MQHENLAELGITEAKKYNEITFHWMAGKTNPADIFTKEDNDVAHYCGLRDLMVVSREQFWNPDSLTDNRWGVLKRGSTDQPESQSVNENEILTQPQKGILTTQSQRETKNVTFHPLSWRQRRTNE